MISISHFFFFLIIPFLFETFFLIFSKLNRFFFKKILDGYLLKIVFPSFENIVFFRNNFKYFQLFLNYFEK